MVHALLAEAKPSAFENTMKQVRSYLAMAANERPVLAPSDRLRARHGMDSLEISMIATTDCGRRTKLN